MECKKSLMYALLGGSAVYGYMKYKDGSMERALKNMKPKFESAVKNAVEQIKK